MLLHDKYNDEYDDQYDGMGDAGGVAGEIVSNAIQWTKMALPYSLSREMVVRIAGSWPHHSLVVIISCCRIHSLSEYSLSEEVGRSLMLLFLAKKLVIFDVVGFPIVFAFFPFPLLSRLVPSAMNLHGAVASCMSKYLSEYSGNFLCWNAGMLL